MVSAVSFLNRLQLSTGRNSKKRVRERLLCHGCPFMVATLGYTWLYNYEVIVSEEAILNLYEKLNNLALEVYCYGGAVA